MGRTLDKRLPRKDLEQVHSNKEACYREILDSLDLTNPDPYRLLAIVAYNKGKVDAIEETLAIEEDDE